MESRESPVSVSPSISDGQSQQRERGESMAFVASSQSQLVLLQGAAAGAPATARFCLVRGSAGAVPGRLVAVVPAATAPGGGGAAPSASRPCTAGDQALSSENAKEFLNAMEQYRAEKLGNVVLGSEVLLRGISTCAKSSIDMLATLVENGAPSLPDVNLEEVVAIGRLSVEVENQCVQGSVRASDLLAAMDGLKRVARIFPGESACSLVEYPVSCTDREAYVKELGVGFLMLYFQVQEKIQEEMEGKALETSVKEAAGNANSQGKIM